MASESSHAFAFDNNEQPTIPNNISLQYINPVEHLQLLKCIVEADIDTMRTVIKECMALSLRCDGSIDRTQIDKIYVLGKIITANGTSKLLFLGVAEQVERQSTGLLKAMLVPWKIFLGVNL